MHEVAHINPLNDTLNSELETPITCLHPRAEWLLRGANLHDEADRALSIVAAAVAARAETPSENQ